MWFSSQASDAAADTMSDVHNHVVETERIGKLHVYVQGGIVNGQTVTGFATRLYGGPEILLYGYFIMSISLFRRQSFSV